LLCRSAERELTGQGCVGSSSRICPDGQDFQKTCGSTLVAAVARAWIEAHLTQRPATVLHGDLLPQNLLWDFMGSGTISVIDWECARIGDPAYDLAIVTRGAQQPLKESGGFARLLTAYNEATSTSLPASAVRIHELLLHLRWLAETARDQVAGTLQGHGPDHYAQKLESMLRRF